MILKMAKQYIESEKELLDVIPLEEFEQVINSLYAAWQNESQIFIFGNGGSAATASHFACDINKGVSQKAEKRFKVICLNDNFSTMLAYANDRCFEDIFVEQLKNFLRPGDVVIGISGSGNSANVIKAVEYAGINGAETIAFTGFDGGRLAKTADTAVVVPINDMQKIEDIHLVLVHMSMQILAKMIAPQPLSVGIQGVSVSRNYEETETCDSQELSKL